jgi:hypothetical protein
MLDFAASQQRLPIRRMTETANPNLYKKLNVQSALPVIYLIQNNAPEFSFEPLTADFVAKFNGNTKELKDSADNRIKYQGLIDSFLALLDGDNNSLKQDSNPNKYPPNTIIEDKKKVPDVYLTRYSDFFPRIYRSITEPKKVQWKIFKPDPILHFP